MQNNGVAVYYWTGGTGMDGVQPERCHVLTYEDEEGDLVMVGDVPWEWVIILFFWLYLISWTLWHIHGIPYLGTYLWCLVWLQNVPINSEEIEDNESEHIHVLNFRQNSATTFWFCEFGGFQFCHVVLASGRDLRYGVGSGKYLQGSVIRQSMLKAIAIYVQHQKLLL